jgi:hypothetical protein
VGAGPDRKAPANLRNGELLSGWARTAHDNTQIEFAHKRVCSAGLHTGRWAGQEHSILAFDIDGAAAVEHCLASGCDPQATRTWQTHRNTDPCRLKVKFKLTAEQANQLGDIKTTRQLKEPIKDEAGNVLAKGEALEIFHQPNSQVVVLGAHPTSKGFYFWPDGMGPEALAPITPEWWALVLALVESEVRRPSSKASSKAPRSSAGEWGDCNPCPICGRNTTNWCSRNRSSGAINCRHGNTFSPELSHGVLRSGQTITGSDGTTYGFCGTDTQSDGTSFSKFVIHDPSKKRNASPAYDPLDKFEVIPGGFDLQATSTAADAADPSRAEVQRLTYRELLALALEAIRIRDQDAEMDLRAELKNTYRISDEQINSALFKQHSASRIKPTERRHDSVCLSEVETLEYLVDGWIPRGDICLTYGSYGTGKTTLAIWKAYCYAKGHNILDRSTPCTPGRSLIIATDSGAAALKKAFSDLGIDPDNDPLLQPGHPEQRIWIWAYAPEQGHAAWICDINGVIQLEEFIKAKEISYVAIDSAKSVSSAADWSYTSNESVKAILTYLREGVCQPTGTCIELLSHDGTAQGSHSGAKAWAEEPSMVCALSVATDPEGRPAGVTAEFKKDRAALVDPRRSLTYKLQDGELVLRPEVEVVGTCEDAILTVLWEAHQRGVEQLKTNSLIEEVWTRFKRSRKTVENTLGRITGTGKGPKPTPLIRPQRGWVALSPLQVQQRASLYRGPYEMGGEVSKSTAAQGICFPPIETPTGEVGGNSNPHQTPMGEVIGGSHPPVVATNLDLSPPMGGSTPPQAAQQVTIHIPAPAPTPSAARQLLGIGELVEVADRTYAPEGVFEVIEAEGDKLLIEGPQGHATPLVISVPAAQCEVVF